MSRDQVLQERSVRKVVPFAGLVFQQAAGDKVPLDAVVLRLLRPGKSSNQRCRKFGKLETAAPGSAPHPPGRSEEHTSELQSLMRTSYAVFCLKTQTQM